MRLVPSLSVIGLIVALGSAEAQAPRPARLEMRLDGADYYPWITQLSLGRTEWTRTARDSIVGRRYRAVVLTSEIYSTLVVERVTLGQEGCCARIAWARRVNLEPLRKRFALGPAIVGLIVGSWRSANTFEFTVQRRRFLATITNESMLSVEEW